MSKDYINFLYSRKFRDTYRNISDVKAAFKRFDKNRDGALSKTEMARMMFRYISR